MTEKETLITGKVLNNKDVFGESLEHGDFVFYVHETILEEDKKEERKLFYGEIHSESLNLFGKIRVVNCETNKLDFTKPCNCLKANDHKKATYEKIKKSKS